MKTKTVLKYLLAVAMAAYMVFAIWYASRAAAADTCSGMSICVVDSVSRGFVTGEDIEAELQTMGLDLRNTRRDQLDLNAIEEYLMAMDKIESVNCMILNNGVLRINVTPLLPRARVFDIKGEDYYINREGKRMKADTRYRIDVPVVVGDFNPNRLPSICFPVLEYLDSHPAYAEMVSSLEIKRNKDIIIVPAVKGHVINLGDCEDLDNKFQRLAIFYRNVMPVKGWEFYDTLSVKWRGQIVAKRRHAKESPAPVINEEHEDVDDVGTMSGGPTLPETIPAAADRKKDVEKPAPEKKETPEKKTAPEKKETPDKKTSPEKKSSPDKKAANDKKATPDKKTDKKTDKKSDKKTA